MGTALGYSQRQQANKGSCLKLKLGLPMALLLVDIAQDTGMLLCS